MRACYRKQIWFLFWPNFQDKKKRDYLIIPKTVYLQDNHNSVHIPNMMDFMFHEGCNVWMSTEISMIDQGSICYNVQDVEHGMDTRDYGMNARDYGMMGVDYASVDH